jgi:hypothetical protein
MIMNVASGEALSVTGSAPDALYIPKLIMQIGPRYCVTLPFIRNQAGPI